METKEIKGVEKKVGEVAELLKDLLILELSKAKFDRPKIRKILGKISNERISRIASVIKKQK